MSDNARMREVEKENDQFRRASNDKMCLATKLVVTREPCRHGYTWQCPRAVDLVALLGTIRQNIGLQSGDELARQIEEALPFVQERRIKGPVDRRQPRWSRLDDCCLQCGSAAKERRLYVTKGSSSAPCDDHWHGRR